MMHDGRGPPRRALSSLEKYGAWDSAIYLDINTRGGGFGTHGGKVIPLSRSMAGFASYSYMFKGFKIYPCLVLYRQSSPHATSDSSVLRLLESNSQKTLGVSPLHGIQGAENSALPSRW